MDGETEAAPEPVVTSELPLAFQLSLAIPVFAVFVFFFLRWFRPRPDEPSEGDPSGGA